MGQELKKKMSSKKISAYSNPSLLLLQKAQEHQRYIKALQIKYFNLSFLLDMPSIQPFLTPCTTAAATHTGGAPAPHSRDVAGAEQSQAREKFAVCHHQSSVTNWYFVDSGKWCRFSSEFSTKVGPWILPWPLPAAPVMLKYKAVVISCFRDFMFPSEKWWI